MFFLTRRSNLIRLVGYTALTVSLAATVPVHAQSAQSASSRSLEGAWWVTVTQYNCATGVKRPPFTSMLLFSRGGTLTETTSNPGFLPGQRSVGFGTWSSDDKGAYTASDVAFIQFTGGAFQMGTQTLTHSITLNQDGDTFTDNATVQFNDTTGAPILSGCATATATRLH